jgi:hypothetical protein
MHISYSYRLSSTIRARFGPLIGIMLRESKTIEVDMHKPDSAQLDYNPTHILTLGIVILSRAMRMTILKLFHATLFLMIENLDKIGPLESNQQNKPRTRASYPLDSPLRI